MSFDAMTTTYTNAVRHTIRFTNYELSMFVEIQRGGFAEKEKIDMVTLFLTDTKRKLTRSQVLQFGELTHDQGRRITNHFAHMDSYCRTTIEAIFGAWITSANFLLAREKKARDEANTFRVRIQELKARWN